MTFTLISEFIVGTQDCEKRKRNSKKAQINPFEFVIYTNNGSEILLLINKVFLFQQTLRKMENYLRKIK